jgi:hypothetical protein
MTPWPINLKSPGFFSASGSVSSESIPRDRPCSRAYSIEILWPKTEMFQRIVSRIGASNPTETSCKFLGLRPNQINTLLPNLNFNLPSKTPRDAIMTHQRARLDASRRDLSAADREMFDATQK